MELSNKLKAAEEALAKKTTGAKMLKEEVTETDIAEIISKWTGGESTHHAGMVDTVVVFGWRWRWWWW